MIEAELQVTDKVQSEVVGRIVEQVCASDDLRGCWKGRLVRFSESIHWYFKQVKQKGTPHGKVAITFGSKLQWSNQ